MFIYSVTNLTVLNVISANRLLNSPIGITTYRKNRENWAIALKLKGKTVYTVNGKDVLCDSLHPVILPKGCNYSWKCYEPGECIIIEFDAPSFELDFNSFEIKDNSTITNAFSKIEKALSLRRSYYKLECRNYVYTILLYLLKSIKTEHVHPKSEILLKPAVEYITHNYFDSSITNDLLAELCKISNVYFRKKFESTYGISPIKYLHNFRINKAKDLLLSDYESIEQVAQSVGYNSIYNFSKMFKAYTGISPTKYNKASRK